MTISLSSYVEKVRKAIDDITPGVIDDFASDANNEIKQAIRYAVDGLLMVLPLEMLIPTVKSEGLTTGKRETDGSGYVLLDDSKFLRFESLTVSGWIGSVTELMDWNGEEVKMQRSAWSRGTASKPKAVFDFVRPTENAAGTAGSLAIRFWPSTAENNVTVSYIERAEVQANDADKLICALREGSEKSIVYQACRIYLEGKKESEMAEKFSKLFNEL